MLIHLKSHSRASTGTQVWLQNPILQHKHYLTYVHIITQMNDLFTYRSNKGAIWGANSSSAHSSRVQVREYSGPRTQHCYQVELPVQWRRALSLTVQPISTWDHSSQPPLAGDWVSQKACPQKRAGWLATIQSVLSHQPANLVLGALDPGRWICDKQLAHLDNAVLWGLSEQLPYSFEPLASLWAP